MRLLTAACAIHAALILTHPIYCNAGPMPLPEPAMPAAWKTAMVAAWKTAMQNGLLDSDRYMTLSAYVSPKGKGSEDPELRRAKSRELDKARLERLAKWGLIRLSPDGKYEITDLGKPVLSRSVGLRYKIGEVDMDSIRVNRVEKRVVVPMRGWPYAWVKMDVSYRPGPLLTHPKYRKLCEYVLQEQGYTRKKLQKYYLGHQTALVSLSRSALGKWRVFDPYRGPLKQ